MLPYYFLFYIQYKFRKSEIQNDLPKIIKWILGFLP